MIPFIFGPGLLWRAAADPSEVTCLSDIVLTYRKSLRHSLRCSHLISHRLMSRFDRMVHPYLEPIRK